MATWPTTGTDPWFDELHTYIDEGDEAAADAANITTVPVSPFIGTTVQDNLDELTPLVPRSSGTPWTALADSGRGAVTSGTGETFLATFQVPANSVSVGQIIELTAILQSSSTGTFTPRIRIGTAGTISDSAVNVSGVSAAGAANSFVIVRAFVYVVATGASSTMAAAIQGVSTAASFTNATAAESLGNVNTAAQFFITFAGTASAGTYTVRAMKLNLI